jgi:hypothetical protein
VEKSEAIKDTHFEALKKWIEGRIEHKEIHPSGTKSWLIVARTVLSILFA